MQRLARKEKSSEIGKPMAPPTPNPELSILHLTLALDPSRAQSPESPRAQRIPEKPDSKVKGAKGDRQSSSLVYSLTLAHDPTAQRPAS